MSDRWCSLLALTRLLTQQPELRSSLVFYGRLFVVTAAHVVRDWPLDKLFIIPCDGSKHPPRLGDGWRVMDTDDGGDMYDVVVIEASTRELKRKVQKKSRMIHLTSPAASRWFPERHTARFFLFGYPTAAAEGWEYLQARSRINTRQILLRGHYVDPSVDAHCHRLRVENPVGLGDFDGLSGSPIFSLRTDIAAACQPTFCGMALRGTSSSGFVHFVSAEIVLDRLRQASNSGATMP